MPRGSTVVVKLGKQRLAGRHTTLKGDAIFIASVLTAIALAATVFALLLQSYFGRNAFTIAAGPMFAVWGVLFFAWFKNGRG
jgi:hypothetical protein